MTLGGERWVEVTPSQFDHETEGLEIVRKLLPDVSPYRAWSNFEFRDNHGRWHEVDLLVLGKSRLHLVELKYYSGTLRGNDQTWLRDGRRAEPSPLKLTCRKAQYLASRLKDQLVEWSRKQGVRVPTSATVAFIQEAVFLHHPGLRCELGELESKSLYGLDHHEIQTGLPGISSLLVERPSQPHVVTATHERIVPILMEQLGLVPPRERTAGSWVIEESLTLEGEGWQDCYHEFCQTRQARIRFLIRPPHRRHRGQVALGRPVPACARGNHQRIRGRDATDLRDLFQVEQAFALSNILHRFAAGEYRNRIQGLRLPVFEHPCTQDHRTFVRAMRAALHEEHDSPSIPQPMAPCPCPDRPPDAFGTANRDVQAGGQRDRARTRTPCHPAGDDQAAGGQADPLRRRAGRVPRRIATQGIDPEPVRVPKERIEIGTEEHRRLREQLRGARSTIAMLERLISVEAPEAARNSTTSPEAGRPAPANARYLTRPTRRPRGTTSAQHL